jgi:hypothetical protein
LAGEKRQAIGSVVPLPFDTETQNLPLGDRGSRDSFQACYVSELATHMCQ